MLTDLKEQQADNLKISHNPIHPYYTPKPIKIQAFLAKIAFFVDNDGYLC